MELNALTIMVALDALAATRCINDSTGMVFSYTKEAYDSAYTALLEILSKMNAEVSIKRESK